MVLSSASVAVGFRETANARILSKKRPFTSRAAYADGQNESGTLTGTNRGSACCIAATGELFSPRLCTRCITRYLYELSLCEVLRNRKKETVPFF